MSDIEDEEYFIDYSTILSNTTTNLSLNNTTNSVLKSRPHVSSETKQEDTLVDFTSINSEFVNMGFESILTHTNSLDQTSLAKNLQKLLKSFSQLNDNFNRIQTE